MSSLLRTTALSEAQASGGSPRLALLSCCTTAHQSLPLPQRLRSLRRSGARPRTVRPTPGHSSGSIMVRGAPRQPGLGRQ
eukprot:14728804-Alexandrium_andersonii.AAC.1